MSLTESRWLTAFIFASQDYSQHNCRLNSPPGLSCSKKHANQSFIFLALYVSDSTRKYHVNLVQHFHILRHVS